MMQRLLLILILLHPNTGTAQASPTDIVTSRGIGQAKFGMTLAQLGRALQEPLKEPAEPGDRACFYVEPRTIPGTALMIEEGRLRRIDVHTKKIATKDGFRIGVESSKLKAKYGARLIDEPHHYSGPEDRYLTVPLSPTIAARFETTGTKVDTFYVGYKEQVQYVEGCL